MQSIKKHYRQLSLATIKTYAQAAGLPMYTMKDGTLRIGILCGLDLWHYVDAKQVQRDNVYRARFWRCVFMGPKHSHFPHWDASFNPYKGLPSPEEIHRGMKPTRNLRQWVMVAENRLRNTFV